MKILENLVMEWWKNEQKMIEKFMKAQKEQKDIGEKLKIPKEIYERTRIHTE